MTEPRKRATSRKAAPKKAADDGVPEPDRSGVLKLPEQEQHEPTPARGLTSLPAVKRPGLVVARVHAYLPTHQAGAETTLHALLRALVEHGHRVEVWLTRYSTYRAPYEVEGVRVVPFASRTDFAERARVADVVISHLHSVGNAAALTRGFGSKLVVLAHNTRDGTFAGMLGGVDLAVFNSDTTQQAARAFFAQAGSAHGAPPARELVVHPPVYGGDYATTPGDAVTLVNTCRDKGGELLRELAARMPQLPFLAVKGAYGQQLAAGSLPSNVQVLEHDPAMRERVFARTRVLLMPSAYEAFGRVGVEAMHSGIPVIAHPTPGLVESLGDAAHFVDRGDVDGWEKQLRQLMDEAEVWQHASHAALQRAAELDPTGGVDAFCQAIDQLMGR